MALNHSARRITKWGGLAAGLLFAVLTVAIIATIGIASSLSSSPGSIGMPARHSDQTTLSSVEVRFAHFGAEIASKEVRHVADWIADSSDNANIDFIIVDKKYASVYVFDGDARLRGSAPVLLGAARGDHTVPGIGSRPIADVLPEERTTPAGRFVAELGHNTRGEDVVWIDYDAAVSMHRVLTTNPEEQRLERLATPTVDDNRISYGCINVPVAFYDTYIRPIFITRRAIVYVLPEVKDVQQVFGSYDVAAAHRLDSARSNGITRLINRRAGYD